MIKRVWARAALETMIVYLNLRKYLYSVRVLAWNEILIRDGGFRCAPLEEGERK